MSKDYGLCVLHKRICDVDCNCIKCPYCSDKDKEWLNKQDKRRNKMIINEKKGDLFKIDEKYSLAHCISLDCAMGAGIAVEFNKRFKGMKKDLQTTIEDNYSTYPITIMYYDNNNRKVFNLITKSKYYNKPTYKTISRCIEQMSKMCKKYNVKYLAMPKIGCGLDRLQWGIIKEIIQEYFEDLDIEIEVRYL